MSGKGPQGSSAASQVSPTGGAGKSPSKPHARAGAFQPDNACSFGPCQGTSNAVLNLLGTLLQERARAHGGRLAIGEIMSLVETFKTAPGELGDFYSRTYDSCHAVDAGADPAAADLENFDRAIGGLLGAESGPLTMSNIQVIGVAEIKSQLGQRWWRLSEAVHRIATEVIRDHLPEDGYVTRGEDDGYLVCFGRMDSTEAWFKAQAIVSELKDRILGEGQNAEIEGVGLTETQLEQLSKVTAYSESVDIPEDAREAGSSIAALVNSKLRQAAQSMSARATEIMAEIAEKASIRPRPVVSAKAVAAKMEVCEFDPQTQAKQERLLVCVGDDAATRAELDLILLASAADSLYQRAGNDHRLLVTSVHCSTLRDRRWSESYLETCGNLLDRALSRLVINLRGCSHTMAAAEVEDFLQRLAPYSRLKMLTLRDPRRGMPDLPTSGLHLAAVEYSDVAAMAHGRPRDLAALVQRANASGARMLVENLSSRAQIERLTSVGIDLFTYQAASAGWAEHCPWLVDGHPRATYNP